MYGFQGTMLTIDLTERKVLTENLDERFARNYIGGVGFGFRLLYIRLDLKGY
ncbi:MAG: aldehyde ferredoxin oxidoreductase N-terminal domain-containing protein [bacterium]